MSLGRPTFVLILITVGVKILGFVEKQVIAYYFGVDERVDALFVAISVPTALFLLVREIVEPAYLPLFVRQLEVGRRDRGGKLFTAVGLLVIGVMVPLVVAGWLGATALAGWLAPGFEPAAQELTARLIRWTIAGGALLGLSALTYITLNAQGRFALPASGDLVLKVAPILCALLFAPRLGVVALALGMLLGALGRLLVHLFGLRGELRRLAWPLPEMGEELRELSWLMAPLVLAFALEALLVPFYYALRDTRTPALLGMLGVTINIGLTAVLIGPLGVGGVAAALTCSKSIKVLLLGGLLQRKRQDLAWTPIFGTALRLGLTATGAATAMYFLRLFLKWPGSAAGVPAQLAYLTAVSTAGLAVFVVAALLVRSPERSFLIASWRAVRRMDGERGPRS